MGLHKQGEHRDGEGLAAGAGIQSTPTIKINRAGVRSQHARPLWRAVKKIVGNVRGWMRPHPGTSTDPRQRP